MLNLLRLSVATLKLFGEDAPAGLEQAPESDAH